MGQLIPIRPGVRRRRWLFADPPRGSRRLPSPDSGFLPLPPPPGAAVVAEQRRSLRRWVRQLSRALEGVGKGGGRGGEVAVVKIEEARVRLRG